MSLDHVTIHVPPGTLESPGLALFMKALGFSEVPAKDPFEHDWNVRWWIMQTRTLLGVKVGETTLHLVEGSAPRELLLDHDDYALGHICVKVDSMRKAALSASSWCERDSGSGRIWLQFANIRVEVR